MTGCKNDNTPIDEVSEPTDEVSAPIITGLEIVDDTIFVRFDTDIYLLSLDGQVKNTIPDSIAGNLVGIDPYLLTSTNTYDSSGVITPRDVVGRLYHIEGENTAYMLDDSNKVRKVDSTFSYSEADISEAVSQIGQNITLRRVFFYNDVLIISYIDDDNNSKSVLVQNGEVISFGDFTVKQVIISDDGYKLFVNTTLKLYVYDFASGSLLSFPDHPITIFKINGSIYYGSHQGNLVFNDSTFTFENASFPSELDFIVDVETYEGIDFIANKDSIWKRIDDTYQLVISFTQ